MPGHVLLWRDLLNSVLGQVKFYKPIESVGLLLNVNLIYGKGKGYFFHKGKFKQTFIAGAKGEWRWNRRGGVSLVESFVFNKAHLSINNFIGTAALDVCVEYEKPYNFFRFRIFHWS